MKTIFTLTFIFLVGLLNAQTGTLDKTFGEQGKLLSSTLTGLPYPANSVIVKKDGDILVGSGEGAAFLLKQFSSNGTTDSSFGKEGEVRTIFKNYLAAYTTAVSITGDNKIVAAGVGEGGGGTRIGDILLAQYYENGNIDSSFGVNGSLALNLNLIEIITCMKITSRGKILLGGYASTDYFTGKYDFFLVQFNANGSLDTKFGASGKVLTDVGTPYQSYINSIVLTPDNSIIAAGYAEYIPNTQQNQILLAKFDMNGKIQADFGTNGLVFTNVGTDADYAYAVALQNDGKIVTAGAANYKFLDSSAMAIVRYNSDGSIDKSFNNTGFLSIFFGKDNAQAKALIIQPNGNYLLGGTVFPDLTSPPNYEADFGLVSITKDGNVDSSFGTNGQIITDFSGLKDECDAITLQPDGKIIAAGGSTDVTNNITYITLARYNGFEYKRQLIITKIRHWIQHHNGIEWDYNNNISSYVVQRSYDGVHFNSIARINANNSSNYTYADPSPLSSTNYYRLQTTSANGAVNYSNVLAISYQPLAVSLSPNPATNVLRIEGLSALNNLKLTVVDFNGNPAISQQLMANSNSSYNLNIASLKPGNYLLKIESQNNVVTKPFVKE